MSESLGPDAKVFQDYRDMLSELGDRIDAVTVSTPDHMHAFIGLDAMRQEKHVYCQKPLTHNVWEARQMALQAKKSNVITRLGNQIHSHEFYRTAVQAIQSGAIGKVSRVHSWCTATGHGKSFHISRPKNPVEPPKTLDWDKWVGVAPMRPYGDWKVYHPWGWRDWQDFGNGALGDFGCHILDPVFHGVKDQQSSRQFRCHSYRHQRRSLARANNRGIRFPRNGPDKRSKSSYHPGTTVGDCQKQKVHICPQMKVWPSSGSLFIGESGSLVLPHVGALRIYPDAKVETVEGLNHYHGWIDGCLSGTQPSDGFDYGGPLTEAVLLGNIAVRYRGTKLEWDAESMKITNHEEANKWLRREYRNGWDIAPVT